MTGPNILIIDDGELDDVRAILESVGVDYTRWDKEEEHDELPAQLHMLITTGSHAIRRNLGRPTTKGTIWIATATSFGERARLLQLGCNYVLRQPVHPSALRMLVQCALYGGDDRRSRRVAVGAPVTFRWGLRRRRATLVDLSARGCCLLCAEDVPKGTDLTVALPAELAGGQTLNLKGQVVRSQIAEPVEGQRPGHSLAVRFRSIHEADRPLVTGILVTLAAGPATWNTAKQTSFKSSADSSHREILHKQMGPAVVERRREPRGSYAGRVAPEAFPDHHFKGHDLSIDGLRVHAHSALTLGAQVRLMIEDEDGGEPVLVAAKVIRVDESGAAFEFEWIEDGGDARLSDIAARLPRIDSRDAKNHSSIFGAASSFTSRVASAFHWKKQD